MELGAVAEIQAGASVHQSCVGASIVGALVWLPTLGHPFDTGLNERCQEDKKSRWQARVKDKTDLDTHGGQSRGLGGSTRPSGTQIHDPLYMGWVGSEVISGEADAPPGCPVSEFVQQALPCQSVAAGGLE